MRANLRKLNLLYPTAFLILGIIAFSCTQPEGYGGNASVRGHIITEYYNSDFSNFLRVEPAIDEEIFLLFGDEEGLGDRTFSSLTGAFQFEFLRPGDYTLYYMTEDSTEKDRDEHTVSINFTLKGGEDLVLDTLVEFKTLDFDEGTGKISGVIRLVNYTNESVFPFLEVKDTSYAQDREVFIRFQHKDYYEDRIRTSFNGYFEFPNLIDGDYEVFTYSEDISGGTEDIVVRKSVTISPENQDVDLGEIIVEQL